MKLAEDLREFIGLLSSHEVEWNRVSGRAVTSAHPETIVPGFAQLAVSS